MKGLWECPTYEAWWVGQVLPRQRFCRGRRCFRLVTAYPLLRPTLCRKHSNEAWMAATAHIRACSHENTRPNPEATAVLDRNPRVCLDCGTGIVSWPGGKP